MNLRLSVPLEQNRPMTQEFLVVIAIADIFGNSVGAVLSSWSLLRHREFK